MTIGSLGGNPGTLADESRQFDAWVRAHRTTLKRLVAAMAPGLDSEDVVQEALTQAWSKRATFDPEKGTPRAWLLAITAGQCLHLQRSAWRWRRAADRAASISTRSTPTADFDLRKNINSLPSKQRQAIVYYYYADITIAEIARIMSCSDGTVKSNLADARRTLSKKLGESQ